MIILLNQSHGFVQSVYMYAQQCIFQLSIINVLSSATELSCLILRYTAIKALIMCVV